MPRPKGAIIDLDGTIYVGKRIAPGAQQGLDYLRSNSIPHVFLTNNGSRTRTETAQFLASLGIDVSPDEVVTSSSLLALRLSQTSPDPVVCIGGGAGLPGAIREVGLMTVELDEPGVSSFSLAVGWKDQLDFDLLSRLLAVEDRIRRVFVTDRDRIYPGENGEVLPGTSWIAGAFEALLEMKAVLAGKPSVGAFTTAAEIIRVPIDQTVVIGDSLESDVNPALASGAQAILLHGPLSKRKSPNEPSTKCDICNDLAEAVGRMFP
jgi:HAD superfamily hydrolase (TIGR01450 family)